MREEKELRDLLSDEAKRERRAYKRATLFVVIAVVAGLAWLGYSAYKVTTMQRKSSDLSAQIESQKTELTGLDNRLTETRNELEVATQNLSVTIQALDQAADALGKTKNDFQAIAAGKGNPRTRAKVAIKRVEDASEQVSVTTKQVDTTSNRWNQQWQFWFKVRDKFSTRTGHARLGVSDGHDEVTRVPNLVGLPLSEATKALDRLGLGYEVQKGDQQGKVVAQDPPPGTAVRLRSIVKLSFPASQ